MTIVVGTDFSERSDVALKYAHLLSQLFEERLHVVNATDLDRDMEGWRLLVETPDDIARQIVTERQEALDRFIEASLGEASPDSLTRAVHIGSPDDVMRDVLEAEEASFGVVGTVGESMLKELFLGSTARHMIMESPAPVVVVPPHQLVTTPRCVLAPVDLSPSAKSSLSLAVKWAKRFDAKLIVVHCFLVPNPAVVFGIADTSGAISPERLRTIRQAQLEQMLEELDLTDAVDVLELRNASADFGINEAAAEHGADIIIMGTAGRRGVARFFVGNTAERILRHAPCAVLAVQDEKHD